MRFYTGISINDWAIPLHLTACRPYQRGLNTDVVNQANADANYRWVTQVILSIFCFYLAVEW